jgi:hypothetical protein
VRIDESSIAQPWARRRASARVTRCPDEEAGHLAVHDRGDTGRTVPREQLLDLGACRVRRLVRGIEPRLMETLCPVPLGKRGWFTVVPEDDFALVRLVS